MEHSRRVVEGVVVALGVVWLAAGAGWLENAPTEGALLGRLAVEFVALIALNLVLVGWHPWHRTGRGASHR